MARIYGGSPYVSPNNVLTQYRLVVQNSERIMRYAFRAWALDVAVEPPAEAAIIDHLFANCQVRDPGGVCNRPRSFWRALVAYELFTAFPGYNGSIPPDHMNTDFTGRAWTPQAAVTQFFSIGNTLPELAASGDLSYSTLEDEILVLGDHMDSWKDMDVYLGALFLFFVEAPAGPPSGGLTCGEGTHEENGECVPDVPTCPTFEAQWAPGQTPADAIAQCVAVP